MHDAVVHAKKRVRVSGKWVWKKPVYIKLHTHVLPDDKELKAQAGTQIIDRAWGVSKSHLKGVAAKPGSARMVALARSAQWLYWNRGADLWVRTGELLRASRGET